MLHDVGHQVWRGPDDDQAVADGPLWEHREQPQQQHGHLHWVLNRAEPVKISLSVIYVILNSSLCIVYNITVCMSCKHGNMFHSIFMNIHYVAELIFIINCILKHKIISNIKIQWMGIKIQFYFDYSRTFLLFHICFDGETWKVFASSCQFKFPFLLLAVRFPQSTKF